MIGLIELYNCTNVRVQGVTLKNSPTWTLHPFGCNNVHISNVTVLGPRAIGGVSGIHPDSSRNVLVENCYVDVGDDAIVVASYLGFDDKPLPSN